MFNTIRESIWSLNHRFLPKHAHSSSTHSESRGPGKSPVYEDFYSIGHRYDIRHSSRLFTSVPWCSQYRLGAIWWPNRDMASFQYSLYDKRPAEKAFEENNREAGPEVCTVATNYIYRFCMRLWRSMP